MSILDRIKGNPFEKLKRDDIVAERIRLEREEKLKIAEVERLSGEKKELFDKGFKVGEAERRALARQMQERDNKIKLDQNYLSDISKNIQVVDAMNFFQERKKMLEERGLMNKILKMPRKELEIFLERIGLQLEKNRGNTQAVVDIVGAELGLVAEPHEDKETSKLMDIWATSDATQADEIYEKLEKEKAAKEKRESETA